MQRSSALGLARVLAAGVGIGVVGVGAVLIVVAAVGVRRLGARLRVGLPGDDLIVGQARSLVGHAPSIRRVVLLIWAKRAARKHPLDSPTPGGPLRISRQAALSPLRHSRLRGAARDDSGGGAQGGGGARWRGRRQGAGARGRSWEG